MDVYGIPEDPSLTTHSRVRAWWLHSVWGYRVLDVRREPRAGWFGRLSFDETIRLLPGSDEIH